jgi:hypothetical protein
MAHRCEIRDESDDMSLEERDLSALQQATERISMAHRCERRDGSDDMSPEERDFLALQQAIERSLNGASK